MKKLLELNNDDLLYNGVYRIINIKTNKSYIGSCSAKDFLKIRLLHHKQDLIKGVHCNNYLQRSFNKYGIENFFYEILEICEPEFCIDREQFYIDKLQPEYNLCKIAGSSFGRVLTEETKIKMSLSQKKRWEENPQLRINMSSVHKGKKLTKEQIEHRSSLIKGRKHSQETKELIREKIKQHLKNNPDKIIKISKRMSERIISKETIDKMQLAAQKRNGKRIICKDNNIIFNCVREVAEYFNISKYTIQDILRNKRKNYLNIFRID